MRQAIRRHLFVARLKVIVAYWYQQHLEWRVARGGDVGSSHCLWGRGRVGDAALLRSGKSSAYLCASLRLRLRRLFDLRIPSGGLAVWGHRAGVVSGRRSPLVAATRLTL